MNKTLLIALLFFIFQTIQAQKITIINSQDATPIPGVAVFKIF